MLGGLFVVGWNLDQPCFERWFGARLFVWSKVDQQDQQGINSGLGIIIGTIILVQDIQRTI